MVICLFGSTYVPDHDVALESSLDQILLPELRKIDGFVSFHMYRAEDGEVLGVVRFDNRRALESWRNDLTHRRVWEHAPTLYEHFWIQNCDTYREYGWARAAGRTGEDLRTRFAADPSNLARALPTDRLPD